MVRLDFDVPLAYTVIEGGTPNTFSDLIFRASDGSVFWLSRGGVQRATDNMELITVFHTFDIPNATVGKTDSVIFSHIEVSQ